MNYSENSVSLARIEDEMAYQSYESVHNIPQIRDLIDGVAREILSIVIVQKGKTVKDINKLFQATLSNYFFECYVCGLISQHNLHKRESKSEIKRRIEYPLKNLNKNNQNDLPKIPKYMQLIQIYNEEIVARGLEREYISMLSDIVKGNSELELEAKNLLLADKTSKKYATIIQKKLCAVLVLESFLSRHSIEPKYRNFNELWNSVFPNFRINYFAREQNIVMGKLATIEQFLPTNQSTSSQIIGKVASIKSIKQSSPNKTTSYFELLAAAATQNNFIVTSNAIMSSQQFLSSRDTLSSKSILSLSFSNGLEDELKSEQQQASNVSPLKQLGFMKKDSNISNRKTKRSDSSNSYQITQKKLKTVSYSVLSEEHSVQTLEIVQSVGSHSFIRESSSSLRNIKSQHDKM